jgi:hypothetical protein
MASFAFATPVITEEEERREREELTDDERQNLHNDVHGGRDQQLVTETAHMLEHGVDLLRPSVDTNTRRGK